MQQRFRYELLVVGTILIISLGFLTVAIFNARAYVRDDLRRQDLTNIKRALEQYYNKHERYPTPKPMSDSAPSCTSSNDLNSWFFGMNSPLITEQFTDVMPHDTREEKGVAYTYCITHASSPGQSYYLEAQLEGNYELGRAFDEDEQRKFHYLILRENDRTFYRVCGGKEKQCEEST